MRVFLDERRNEHRRIKADPLCHHDPYLPDAVFTVRFDRLKHLLPGRRLLGMDQEETLPDQAWLAFYPPNENAVRSFRDLQFRTRAKPKPTTDRLGYNDAPSVIDLDRHANYLAHAIGNGNEPAGLAGPLGLHPCRNTSVLNIFLYSHDTTPPAPRGNWPARGTERGVIAPDSGMRFAVCCPTAA